MALIRPCADLRNNYNEISKICHETKEPMYITKNGTNDLVILSDVIGLIMLFNFIGKKNTITRYKAGMLLVLYVFYMMYILK